MKVTFGKNNFSMTFFFKRYNKVVFILLTSFVFAQQSAIYTSDLKQFNQAISLFKTNQFQSAATLFEKVKKVNFNYEMISDCDFFIAKCMAFQNRTESIILFEKWLTNYPTSIKKNEALVELGNLNFEMQNYKTALEWFEKVDEKSISSDVDKFYFQKAFCFYKANYKKEATNNFYKVIDSETFGAQSKYYLGFMAYENDNYKVANLQFNQIQNDVKYKEKMTYFQADINFNLGEFQKAIDLATVALLHSNENEKSELNKIIGESYFNLNQFENAIPFLEAYKGKNGKWSNTDYYILGYALFKKNDYQKAIFQFSKIINGNDFVAQNAYYHLAESYLKSDKKQQALHAFKNASEMDFDPKIQEDANFNYAKLSYEIGNVYQSVPDIFVAFLEKYQTNSNRNEVEALLVDSFITSKNYKEALKVLENSKSLFNKNAIQKVSFYIGLEHFTDGNYKKALLMFEKSIAVQQDSKFLAKATFWKAETQFVLENFIESIVTYKQFVGFVDAANTTEFQNINYNLGYAYFKIKEYSNAATYFQNFNSNSNQDKTRLSDSYLRLGDCFFVNAKYWPAIDSYKKAIELKSVQSDYAAFQKAISYGFLSKNDKKIEDLNAFLKVNSKSQYYDDALFELGNTYISENKNENAIAIFDKLIAEFPTGIYSAKSILKKGLIYFNLDQEDLALLNLKKVVADFPNSPESFEAISTAKIIYFESGKVAEYAIWIKTLKFVQVTDAELDNDTFEAAEKFYLQNNFKQAIAGFVGYISNFPNGIHVLKVNFYLAQLYFADGLENNAVPNYKFITDQQRNEFTEQSLVRLAQIFSKNKEVEKAIVVLKRLETEADFLQNITFAQSNLMKLYFEKSDFLNAVIAAEKVIDNLKTDEKVRSDAQIIIARAAIRTNDLVKAKLAYSKLLLIANGELAAEALFYDAFFKNQDKKYEESNIVVQKLTKNYAGYKYFGAKSLIIMAKNFYGMKDAFQANYILESIIKNFSSFKDVIEEAKFEQEIIQKEEAKTNSSLQKL